MRKLLIVYFFSITGYCYSQDSYDPKSTIILELDAGVVVLDNVFTDIGFTYTIGLKKQVNPLISIGFSQGGIIQDNFPSNFYPTTTAPFHLAPEVDTYIRSLTFGEAFDFNWSKTTAIYFTPFVEVKLINLKKTTISTILGMGVQYRNFTMFELASYQMDNNVLVDYHEHTIINSSIAPLINIGINFSKNISPSLQMKLKANFSHEIANAGDLKNTGPADYSSLQFGLSKKF